MLAMDRPLMPLYAKVTAPDVGVTTLVEKLGRLNKP